MQWRLQRLSRLPLLVAGGVALAYWQRQYLGLPSEVGFYVLALFIFLGFHHVERRLDAVQLRLAWMHDRLDKLAGIEPQHHIEAELDAR
jgi:hypothetical protein